MDLVRFRYLVTSVLVVIMAAAALAGCSMERADESENDSAATSSDGETPTAVAEETVEEQPSLSPTAVATDAADVESSAFPVAVTRTDGVELEIEEPPQRIVSLSPGATETFFAVGAGEQVAAVDMFSDYPEGATELPQVDAYDPDPESIISLEPDLVYTVFNPGGIVEILEDAGIPVLYLDAPRSLSGMLEQIRILGDITGNSEQADELAGSLQERIDDVVARAEEVDSTPSVYHELDTQLFTVGPGSFIGDLYNLLGARNVAEDAEGDYPQLSQEVILEQNPAVIILPTEGHPDEATPEDLRQRPGWDTIDAVRNDRIYQIDADIVSRPGPRIVDALEELAGMLYPEAFASRHELLYSWIDLQSPAVAA